MILLFVAVNGQMTVETDKGEENLWITELERLFGYDSHYTDVGNIPLAKRQQLLGRAWSVPVVTNILRPLSTCFSRNNILPEDESTNDAPSKRLRNH